MTDLGGDGKKAEQQHPLDGVTASHAIIFTGRQ